MNLPTDNYAIGNSNDSNKNSNNSSSNSVIPGWGYASKSFAVSNKDFAKSDPDFIIVSPCGLKLNEAEREARLMYMNTDDHFKGMRAVREGRVVVVDGDAMFNRPGPRLVDALEFLVSLLHGNHHRNSGNSKDSSGDDEDCIIRARDLMPKDFPYKFISFNDTS